VAFGHALLATTPEALLERLPLQHRESGCTITADVRLDNRDELIRKLDVNLNGRTIGDGELILLAYLEWGEGCPEQLLGDFAFAIWDARRRKLFCARDQMGMRQFCYWHRPGQAFVFATEPDAVVGHALVPKRLNEGRVADFLDGLEGQNLEETFYQGVLRLPPGHSLTIDHGRLELNRYWELRKPDPLVLKSDDEYVAAFTEVFREAVTARLRSPGPVAAMLSGGLDSGAVVAFAADLLAERGEGPLTTVSVVGTEAETCRETRAIHASSKMPNIDPHLIRYTELDGYREELERLIEGTSDPFDCYMGMIRTVYLGARRLGVKVVLDGVASDMLFSASANVGSLLRAGRISPAVREAFDEGRYWDSRREGWNVLARSLWSAWTPSALKNARRRLAWRIQDHGIGRRGGLVSPDLARRTHLRDRREAVRLRDLAPDRRGGDQRVHAIGLPYLAVARERYDRVAAAVGIEPRDPFMDLRLIAFCLSLPPSQLQSRGWPKIVLRRALAGKLPDEVRWRRGREHLGGAFTKQWFGGLTGLLSREDLDASVGSLLKCAKTTTKSLNSPDPQDCQHPVEAICLSNWLKSRPWEFSR
jgi:asparagine synthase (glutamine-hydrolysing)